MTEPGIMIVDDEKNIRLTMSQALASLGYEISTAVNGEDALKQLAEKEFRLILLDLKMPGMNGLDVLRQVVEQRPDIRVIIVSAHGTVENAVEATKLGAVDFIQKPFAPKEIRQLVQEVLDRDKLEAEQTHNYDTHLALTKRCINLRHFEAAMEHAKQSIGFDPARPEAFNLLGVLYEIQGDREEGMKNYRVALDLDPSYQPAWRNLRRPKESGKDQQNTDLG
ncbi:MAG: response regulator [Anaerolineae bacterium]|nr:response regulator [Anaerolineae bacterium]